MNKFIGVAILLLVLILAVFFWRPVYQLTDGKRTVVALQPFKGFNKTLSDSIAKVLSHTYGFEIVLMKEIDLPAETFTNFKAPRYKADKLLLSLGKIKPDTVDYIMGLSARDICITKHDALGRIKEPIAKYTDFGIFGLGYCPGKCCVISTYRLGENKIKLYDRTMKVAVHELGHNLGLPHCPLKGCVMSSANESIKTVDNEKLELCANCKKKV